MPQTYYEGECFQDLALTDRTLEGLTLVDCTFTGCDLTGCRLVRCVLTECRFVDCRVSGLKCDSSQARFLQLEGCALTGVNWGLLLPAGGFGTPLERLERCRMKYCFFTDMDLRRFDFTGSTLTSCTFAGCTLAEARLQDCGLAGTEFIRCDLAGADLRKAQGYQVDVPTCTVKGARFTLPEAASLLYSLGIRLE